MDDATLCRSLALTRFGCEFHELTTEQMERVTRLARLDSRQYDGEFILSMIDTVDARLTAERLKREYREKLCRLCGAEGTEMCAGCEVLL